MSKQPKQKLRLTQKPRLKKSKPKYPDLSLEHSLLESGFTRIVGIDEVGRGAWAGPVVVAGFAYDISHKPLQFVHDSKLVSRKQREQLSPELTKTPHKIVTGELDKVNKLGVGKTIHECIIEIVQEFADAETFFLIDGYFAADFGSNVQMIKKGDMLHYSISAASIIAKVYRDDLMRRLHTTHPHYGFLTNVGYPSAYHRQALQKHGYCELHRLSFKPIALMHEQLSLI